VDIGIGIPNTIPGSTGKSLLDWAQRADTSGFSTLATIGAVSYPGYEELTLFAAAGAVTQRVRFLSNVLISPARSAAELAKQAATVDQLTGGRLTLGLGVGWRESDFTLTGRDFATRGKDFDQQLRDLRRALAGEIITDGTREVGPPTVQTPLPIVIGGHSDAAIRRVVENETVVGWTAGGMPPDAVTGFVQKVRAAWSDGGRAGSPRIIALTYFGLGDDERSHANLRDYYIPMGPETADMIAGSALRTPDAIKGAVAAYGEAGVDELILDPSLPEPDQVDRLAEVVLG
jgi:alkanesulfonate monooxygenase SsuD/methylene tetrahydromethanopterin reductase-like flavin-dependent oxidoreductase (luciferase family)